MKTLRLPFALCFILLITATAHGQSKHDLIGSWYNESKSTVIISEISPTGQITGSYVTLSGTSKEKLPIVGWVNPNAPVLKEAGVVPFIFTVRWDTYGSITAWTGYLSKDSNGAFTLSTISNIIRANIDPDTYFEQGAPNIAVFKPGPDR